MHYSSSLGTQQVNFHPNRLSHGIGGTGEGAQCNCEKNLKTQLQPKIKMASDVSCKISLAHVNSGANSF